ncbi:DUF3320 domain-containing protein [Candidatus Poribacteria bacterium]|nr:DUF3320 domain-containing protein [Candidatus Poribacteria bacterium]
MNSIQTKLDKARAELLDLSLRNPLINYKLLKARGVEIIDESPPDIYQILVQDKRTMSFLPRDESEECSFQFEDEAEHDPDRHTDTKLQTNHSSTELQKRLRNTEYTERTAIEEQGVTTLYLALGMLEWYESESSEIFRRAPLIMIPVELNRTSVRANFRVQYTEEEIGTNLSLQEKLKVEFSIQLPDLPDVDDLNQSKIQRYFEEVSEAIVNLNRWSVDDSAIALGFFSFAKFLMYCDLDVNNWPDNTLSIHPILDSVLGNGFQKSGSSIKDSEPNVDQHLTPENTHHVVDADSSQALAIHDVGEGRNLVIQGPPGTGKSQTITNLIAASIMEGKRVLFVAEKMAALEVVKRNLDKVGLGNACLELHSHKMNKKSVVDELKRILDTSEPKITDLKQKLENLLDDRNRLNRYCEAVNTPIGKSGITPYQAYGELLATQRRLSGKELPTLASKDFQHSTSEFRKGLANTEVFQTLLKRMGVPKNHPFWGSRCKVFLPTDRDSLKRASSEAQEKVLKLKDASEKLAQHLNLVPPNTCADVENHICAARHVLDAPDLLGIAVQSTSWETHSSDFEVGFKAGERLGELHKRYDDILIPEAWGQNVLEIRQKLAAYGDKWWRMLSGDHRRVRNELKGLCSQPQLLPKAHHSRLRIVDAILEVQRELPKLEQIQEIGQELFGTHWQGRSSNWKQLREIVKYLSATHQSVTNNELPEAVVTYLASNPNLEELKALLTSAEELQSNYPHLLQTLIDKIQLDEEVRFGSDDGLKQLPFTEQMKIFRCWETQPDILGEMVSYNHQVEELKEKGFIEIVKVANEWSDAGEHLSDLLKQTWYNARIETVMAERPVLAGFSSETHQHIVERFKEFDRISLDYNKVKVAYQHWNNLPQYEASKGQLGILRREFQKKRRHLPIRQLMTKAGNAIQAIKPIFMMSPLSVATFIPPKSVDFDLVVFDEASQVKPVDAFGSIVRGKQIVVVGDTQQLPPTSFFDKHIAEDDDDLEENAPADTESILGLFSAKNSPQRMLRWHYRSRHPSLIAVSNFCFYENRLIIFPSPDAAREKVGLVYHYLPDTAYDRGGSRSNLEEAKIVAKKVMEHARLCSHLTLGVATFSTAQMQAIQDQLELLRREDLSCEKLFFNAHPEEPFFVKNLENVQGDERDIIFISIGYGRDANGKLTMNFGPLGRDGGERRLNVLITRARQRCEVFTNLTADDIDLSRTNARGVEVLKRFLKYAQTDQLDIPELTGKEPDSPFEIEVADALRGCDYEIDHQIGSAGYFIDLGVKDTERPGRYLLGIECDGATYHSAQSARDRDRIRQEVIEGLGWCIHRIWSTDWFRYPDRELRKAVEAIERAKTHDPSPPEPENNDQGSNENENVPEEKKDTRVNPTPISMPNSLSKKYRIASLFISTNGQLLHKVPTSSMAIWIQRIVEIESPVHINEVAKRIANAVGVKKVGSRIQNAVKSAATQAGRSDSIQIKKEFLYWTAQEQITVRDRSELPNASRKWELIAPEEIEMAIRLVVSEAYGIDREDIPHETCRLFGFKKVNSYMQNEIGSVIDKMIAHGKLIDKVGSLVLPEQSLT